MSLFEERLADLPLNIEGYALDGLTRDVSSAGFTRASTVIRMHGAGEEGAGEDVTYDAPDHEVLQAAGPVLPLAGEWTLGLVLRPRRRCWTCGPRAPQREASRALSACGPTSRRRSTSRCARRARRCTPRLGRESRPVALRRLAAPRRAADPRPRGQAPGALPVAAAQARPDHRVDPRDHRRAGGHRRGRLGRLQGPIRGTIVDQAADPVLYRRVVEAFPDAWIEDPKLTPRRPTRSSAPSRPHHLGCAHPRRRGHRGAAVPAADGQRQAVALRAAAAPSSAPTSTARPAGSACTAAGSSSSAPAAVRSNTSPRSFTPARLTTWRPAATTRPTRRGLPDSPLAPMAQRHRLSLGVVLPIRMSVADLSMIDLSWRMEFHIPATSHWRRRRRPVARVRDRAPRGRAVRRPGAAVDRHAVCAARTRDRRGPGRGRGAVPRRWADAPRLHADAARAVQLEAEAERLARAARTVARRLRVTATDGDGVSRGASPRGAARLPGRRARRVAGGDAGDAAGRQRRLRRALRTRDRRSRAPGPARRAARDASAGARADGRRRPLPRGACGS